MANILSQAEVDALLRNYAEDEESPAGVEELPGVQAEGRAHDEAPQLYDFRRPCRVSRDQLRLLHGLHETFALAFSGVLGGYVRSLAEVQVVSLEQLSYAEWIHVLPKSTCLFPFSLEPLEGTAVAHIDNELVLGVVDRLLGGGGTESKVQRDPTQLETSLVARMIDDALRVLADAWAEISRFTPKRKGFEKWPNMLRLLSETEIVLLATARIKLNGASGRMSFCYPLTTIEPVIAKLASAFAQGILRPKGASEGRPWILEGLREGRVPLAVHLGRGAMTIGEFVRLKPGDVIVLDRRVDDPLAVLVGGKTKLCARPGLLGKRLAVQVCRAA